MITGSSLSVAPTPACGPSAIVTEVGRPLRFFTGLAGFGVRELCGTTAAAARLSTFAPNRSDLITDSTARTNIHNRARNPSLIRVRVSSDMEGQSPPAARRLGHRLVRETQRHGRVADPHGGALHQLGLGRPSAGPPGALGGNEGAPHHPATHRALRPQTDARVPPG